MTAARLRCRLFLDIALGPRMQIELTGAEAHYLITVLRAGPGEVLAVFNGRDGEWRAEVAAVGRRGATLTLAERLRPQAAEPDLWLCFAPIKGPRLDALVEKASELGAARLQPVITRRTVVSRVNLARLRATVREAAEQCERLTVPEVAEPVALAALLERWPTGRRLAFCDESGGGAPAVGALAGLEGAPWAVLVGPEGGFDPAEAAAVRRRPETVAVSLGPRVLRADTAAMAALVLWQATLGDWQRPPRG